MLGTSSAPNPEEQPGMNQVSGAIKMNRVEICFSKQIYMS